MKLKVKIIISSILILFLLLFYWGFNINPTITSEDIDINAEIKKVSDFAGPTLETGAEWGIEIELINKHGKNLHDYEKDYFNIIYPYINGYGNIFWDYSEDEEGNYGIGNDSRSLKLVDNKLDELLGSEYNHEEFQNRMGYYYNGSNDNTTIRFYLIPTDEQHEIDPDKSFVIYTHYEKKWGKDVSWVKAFPVEISK